MKKSLVGSVARVITAPSVSKALPNLWDERERGGWRLLAQF